MSIWLQEANFSDIFCTKENLLSNGPYCLKIDLDSSEKLRGESVQS